jgi:hypothetical protein
MSDEDLYSCVVVEIAPGEYEVGVPISTRNLFLLGYIADDEAGEAGLAALSRSIEGDLADKPHFTVSSSSFDSPRDLRMFVRKLVGDLKQSVEDLTLQEIHQTASNLGYNVSDL